MLSRSGVVVAAPGCFCLGSALIGAADRSARRALDSIVCIPAPDETLPIVRCAAGFHQPLDRLGLRLYISAKRFATQPLVLTICPSSTFSVTCKRTWPNPLQSACTSLEPSERHFGTTSVVKSGAVSAHHSAQIALPYGFDVASFIFLDPIIATAHLL
ncbi:hypothetical protein OF001_U220058 [Pseudomonas sp. OF001]|nr:hypothetical protein OF001_U220058 [Pseudomonas sp. OF001]